jgi:hypothetical protein
MTDIFKLTSRARKLLPLDNEDKDALQVAIFGEEFEEVKIRRQRDSLSVFWNGELIVKSTNYLVENFDATHLADATKVLESLDV